MSAWLALSVLLGSALLGLTLYVEESRRRAPLLPPPLAHPPRTTALLPVRDEEENILPCLEALLASTAEPEILVIDDSSTDRTAELTAARAAREPRIRLLKAPPLPEGWRGKVHALAFGEAEARTSWLLSLDADARHAPDLLARAHAAVHTRELDALSLAGRQDAVGLGENLLTPGVFALLDALLGDWEEAARGGGAPVASGQFILVRREAWAACGGFAPIRRETLDDVAMFVQLRAHGFRTGFIRAPELRVRMYRGAREAFLGWRRNFGGFLGSRTALVAQALAALLLPPLALGLAAATGHWVEAALLWTAGAVSSMLVRQGGETSPLYGLLYPLDSIVLAATLALGTLDRRRGRLAAWKGRTIEL